MADALNTPPPTRRGLLSAATAVAALPSAALGGVASTDTLLGDARIFALAEDLRQAEAVAERACELHTIAEVAGDDVTVAVAWVQWEEASNAVDAAVARLAETPATTLPGLLVKALRIAWQIRPETGHQMLEAEHALAASVFADGLRLLPAAAPRPAHQARKASA